MITKVLTTAGLAAAAVQVGPAATWLPSVRRAWPALEGRGPADSVAVTFDDGPHPDGTPAVLDALDRLGWAATFFLLGSQVRKHPEVVSETVRRGHEIAVHGDEHRYLIARTPRAAADDVRRAFDTVTEVAGVRPRWWRPPYGVLSGPALVAVRPLGLRPVLWSAWGRDWRDVATPQTVVADLTDSPMNGGTLLLHDSDLTSATGSWRTTVAALDLLAERVTRDGLTPRRLSEHVR